MSTLLPYPVPNDEDARIKALATMAILNTPPDQAFDIIVDLAAHLFKVPVSLVSVVGRNNQIFKARVGLDLCETSRDISFCAHAIVQRDVLASRDPRFSSNPLVTGAPSYGFMQGRP